jgi:PAS domain S-box-containing protein
VRLILAAATPNGRQRGKRHNKMAMRKRVGAVAGRAHPWLAQFVPVAAALAQLAAWPLVKPLYWVFFYPAIFLSAWLGGLLGGLMATAFSVVLVLYIFTSPQFSFHVEDPKFPITAAIFAVCGVSISSVFDRLRKTRERLETALAETDAARGALEMTVAQRTQELSQKNELLLASEERMRLTIAGVKDYAIFMIDPEGVVTSWNLGAQQLKGWSAEEIIGQNFSRFYTPEERTAGLPQRELEVAKTEGRFTSEGWRQRKDGTRFWADVVITSVQREGRLVGFSKVTRDTTERRRIEQAMREEEARLAAVIGSAMDAVITVDEKQMITLFNPAAEKMFGYPAATVMGTSLERLMPQRFRAKHSMYLRNFSEINITRRKMGELTGIYGLRCDGEEFPIEASISHAQIDGQKIFSVILRDITERVKAIEAVRRSDATRRIALESVQFGDWQVDLRTRLATTSEMHNKIFGYSQPVEKWNFDIFLEHVLPEDRERVRSSYRELTEHGRALDFECRIVWPDHSIHWIWARGGLYSAEAGAPATHMMGTVADISERKRAEALQLRSQKLESLGTLSGGIAHDFNNILLAITGNTKLAMADLAPDNPVQESLQEIAKAGARATELVRRILTFSRPGEIRRQIIDLQPVVEEALKLVRATLPATIEFRTTFAEKLHTVLADATQVHQIVVNLATNAAHAIGGKSDGIIEVRLDAAKLTADDSRPSLDLPEGKYVRLYVSDNGCGMDRATLDRIYDPFFTTKKPGEGTGLGLSVVHGIMKNHDGGIAVYSEPGRGTSFRLFFPAVGTEGARAATTNGSAKAEGPQRRTEAILYVDDEEPLVALVKRTLERLGYRVTGQNDPVKAVELFRSDPKAFDAVVTDLAMPQLSGFDLSSQLLEIRPDLPIVMTSGYVRPEDQERALHMGLRDLILKPDTIEQLARTLDQVFGHDSDSKERRSS